MSFLSAHQKALVDQIGDVLDDVEARMMLGTVGLFTQDQQFGILKDESLYLTVDDDTRSDYSAAGTAPYSASEIEDAAYLEVPAEVVEEEETLAAWVERAVEVAT